MSGNRGSSNGTPAENAPVSVAPAASVATASGDHPGGTAAAPDDSAGEALARAALADPRDTSLEERIKQLTPQEAQLFVQALELAMKKRRIMLAGYLLSLLVLLGGLLWGFYHHTTHLDTPLRGWVFLVPMAGCGAILWLSGRLARRIRR
jgi:hypothetical protein